VACEDNRRTMAYSSSIHNNLDLIKLLLGRLALSHLRLIRFPFRRLLRLAGITVRVFLPASTQLKHEKDF
jgi:hypothetical protein